jgi:hypothetical protein
MWKPKFRRARTDGPPRKRPSRKAALVELDRFALLDRRILPAITATYSAAQGILTITGDAQDNTIAASRNAAGSILVNAGAAKIIGGNTTVANT